MTPIEFHERMIDIHDRRGGDVEACHGLMDDLLCDALRELGYGAGVDVDVYELEPKWYA